MKCANGICKTKCHAKPQAQGMQFRRVCVACSNRKKPAKKEEVPKYFFVAGETRFVRTQGDWNNEVRKWNLQNEVSRETAGARNAVPSRMRCVF